MDPDLSFLEFTQRFDEDTCWEHLRTARWGEDSFQCPRCGEDDHWGFIQTRELFQCHECGKQTSITSGTILADTKLDLATWFAATFLLTTTKKGVSTPDLARKLGISEKTAWFVSHKILTVLGKTEARELFGLVEADETFLAGQADQGGRARNEHMVFGVVERPDDEPGLGRVALRHIPKASRDELHGGIEATVETGSRVRTDGWQPYRGLERHEHDRVPKHSEAEDRQLPAIHTVFGNLKRVVKGVHTHVSEAKLQAFLDVFAFRFNHRDAPIEGVRVALGGLVQAGPVRYGEVRCGG